MPDLVRRQRDGWSGPEHTERGCNPKNGNALRMEGGTGGRGGARQGERRGKRGGERRGTGMNGAAWECADGKGGIPARYQGIPKTPWLQGNPGN